MDLLILFGLALFGSGDQRRAAGTVTAGMGVLMLVLLLAAQLGTYGLIWVFAARPGGHGIAGCDPARDAAALQAAHRARAETVRARNTISAPAVSGRV